MILYNLRRRAPYEYDKFILNTLQLCNEVRSMEQDVREKETSSLLARDHELSMAIEKEISEDSRLSQLLLLREKMGDIY